MKKIFTGALAFVLFVGAANAQTKDSSHHGKGRHEMAQLNLTADQKTKLQAIRQEQRKEMESIKNGSLSKEEKGAKLKELHKKYSDQAATIYTPQQKEQLEKMRSEWKAKGKHGRKGGRGEGKGKDGKFKGAGDRLDLTAEQKEKMEQLRTGYKSQFESIRNDKSLTDAQKKEKFADLKKKQGEEMKSILTKEQLEKAQSFKKERGARNTK